MKAAAPAWFARLGEPLEAEDRETAEAMLRAFDPAASRRIVATLSWADVAEALRAEDRDSRAWDAEEEERERLWARAALHHPEQDLLERLAARNAALREDVHAAAGAAARRSGITDRTLIAAAAGAALFAAHHRHLAELAGAGEAHYFACKFRLFAAGRWPLGPREDGYLVF